MRLPEFTAEVSLGKTRQGYFLAPGAQAETGSVVRPQGIIISHWGNVIWWQYCDETGCYYGHDVGPRQLI